MELFQSGRWGRYFLNSFTITAISTAAAVIINSMAGYAFARLHFKGRDTLFGIALAGNDHCLRRLLCFQPMSL